MFRNAEAIYTYTRAQAIEDGVLHDVSEMGKEAGIKYPVAITDRLTHTLEPPDEAVGQSFSGRLWDVLWMFQCNVTGQLTPVEQYPYGGGECIHFTLDIVNGDEPVKCGPDPWRVELKAVCGPGDNAEPVITIMHVDED